VDYARTLSYRGTFDVCQRMRPTRLRHSCFSTSVFPSAHSRKCSASSTPSNWSYETPGLDSCSDVFLSAFSGEGQGEAAPSYFSTLQQQSAQPSNDESYQLLTEAGAYSSTFPWAF